MTKLRLLTFAIITTCIAPAAAKPPAGNAQRWFEQGRELLAAGDLNGACTAFQASLDIDRALGTLLNLASCQEQRGHIVAALALYEEVIDRAHEEQAAARLRFAARRHRALLPRLASVIVSPPTIPVEGLTLAVGDQPAQALTAMTSFQVDPGTVVLTARAPGHADLRQEIVLADGANLHLTLRPLKALPVPTTGGDQPPFPSPEPAAETAEPEPGPEPAPPGPRHRGRRRLAWIVAGAGGAALVAGLGFGWLASSRWDEAGTHCVGGCDARGLELVDDAETDATVATVLVGAGVLCGAGALYLFLTSREPARAPAAPGNPSLAAPLEVSVSPRGVVLRGSF